MKRFHEAMKTIREQQPGGQIGIARRAFPKASEKKHTTLAAYISKLETEQETNPSLDTIEWIARGCRLSLSAFFLQVENSLLKLPEPPTENAPSSPLGTKTEAANAVGLSPDDRARIAVAQASFDLLGPVAVLTDAIGAAVHEINNATKRLANYYQQVPKARPRSSTRSTSGARRAG